MKRAGRLLLSLLLILSACGTQDYDGDKNAAGGASTGAAPDKLPAAQPTNKQRLLITTHNEGYIWRLLRAAGAPDSKVDTWQCRFRDRGGVSRFKAFGTALFGGAILGIVIRSSGSWFLGKPVEPKPKHWFWEHLDKTSKLGVQGVIRGALFAGVCQTLLAGGNLTPLDGVLGDNFSAASSAIVLGGMTMIAVHPFARKWLEPIFKYGPQRYYKTKTGFWNAYAGFKKWSRSSQTGKIFRQQIAPNLMLVGIGAGTGAIVYNELSEGPGDNDQGNLCWQEMEKKTTEPARKPVAATLQ